MLRIWIYCPYDEGLNTELILRSVSSKASTLSAEVYMQPGVKFEVGEFDSEKEIEKPICASSFLLKPYPPIHV